MAEITMYTKSWCSYCDRAKDLLRAKGQTWTEIDVEAQPEKRDEMIARSQRRTVPQIFLGERHVGGFDDLAALENAGELDALLGVRRAGGGGGGSGGSPGEHRRLVIVG